MRLSDWIHLLAPEHDALRAAAAGVTDPHDPAAVARLRKLGDADTVRAALQLAQARRAAVPKFGVLAATLVADPEGVQQASSLAVAAHKAARVRDTLGEGARILDLCSGIGGDALALHVAGLRVAAIDRDPVRAWMTSQNARVPTACADATRLLLSDTTPFAAYHIDPARRAARGRIFRFADYLPPPALLRDLAAAFPAGVVKLSPGIDLDELHAHGPPGETEFVSEAGRLVQTLQWTGELARSRRTATLIEPCGTTTLSSSDETTVPTSPLRRYVFAIDPAVERAGLIGVLCNQLDAAVIHPALGLLTSDAVLDSPWLTAFEVLESLPWRPAKVKAWLNARGAGIVEVKTRGKAVDPDDAQRLLRGKGDAPFTVFVLRWDDRKVAIVTRRLHIV